MQWSHDRDTAVVSSSYVCYSRSKELQGDTKSFVVATPYSVTLQPNVYNKLYQSNLRRLMLSWSYSSLVPSLSAPVFTSYCKRRKNWSGETGNAEASHTGVMEMAYSITSSVSSYIANCMLSARGLSFSVARLVFRFTLHGFNHCFSAIALVKFYSYVYFSNLQMCFSFTVLVK